MAKKQKNKYNHYSENFRREAVRRSEDPNTSAVEVAKELGIHNSCVLEDVFPDVLADTNIFNNSDSRISAVSGL